MSYKCEWFEIHELVPPELISLPEDYLWELFDEKILVVLDRLRIALGRPITVNNWKSGGQYKFSGFRPKNCKIGAKKSGHKLGKSVDIKVKGMTPAEVLSFIQSRYNEFPEITEIEDIKFTPTWLHISCRHTGLNHLKIIKP